MIRFETNIPQWLTYLRGCQTGVPTAVRELVHEELVPGMRRSWDRFLQHYGDETFRAELALAGGLVEEIAVNGTVGGVKYYTPDDIPCWVISGKHDRSYPAHPVGPAMVGGYAEVDGQADLKVLFNKLMRRGQVPKGEAG